MQKPSDSHGSNGVKVLIAEDDAVSAKILQKNIEEWGYKVVMAKDGRQAWRMFQASDVRLAVLDWMMPGINGLELCKIIRAFDHEHEDHSYTYIILLTAKGHQKDVIKGLSSGADDYITKPFHSLELKARLQTGMRIVDLQRQLQEQADRDGLTGLWNRNRMFRILEKELNRSQREGHPLAAIMIDIDRFKEINDTYGHRVGDTVLREVAAILKKNVRNYDEICRYGGDEMLIILPNCNLAMTRRIAERLRRDTAAKKIKTFSGELMVTLSLGGASSETFFSDITAETLLTASDEALLEAKTKGRNKVVIKK